MDAIGRCCACGLMLTALFGCVQQSVALLVGAIQALAIALAVSVPWLAALALPCIAAVIAARRLRLSSSKPRAP